MNATARAQAADALEQAARTLKRHIRDSRELLGIVRRAQVGLLGIEITSQSGDTVVNPAIPARADGGEADRSPAV